MDVRLILFFQHMKVLQTICHAQGLTVCAPGFLYLYTPAGVSGLSWHTSDDSHNQTLYTCRPDLAILELKCFCKPYKAFNRTGHPLLARSDTVSGASSV